MDRRRALIFNQSRLPSEYQEVEWIGTSGTQYIDTGVKMSDHITKVQAHFYRTSDAFRQILFGCYNGQVPNIMYYDYNETDGKSKLQWGLYNNYAHNFTIGDVVSGFTYNSTAIPYSVNGVTAYVSPVQSITGEKTYYLFATNSNGTAKYFHCSRMYSFKIYVDDVLFRDFVPCYRKIGTVIGLYDLVNAVFYTNKGIGTFTKGADVL